MHAPHVVTRPVLPMTSPQRALPARSVLPRTAPASVEGISPGHHAPLCAAERGEGAVGGLDVAHVVEQVADFLSVRCGGPHRFEGAVERSGEVSLREEMDMLRQEMRERWGNKLKWNGMEKRRIYEEI